MKMNMKLINAVRNISINMQPEKDIDTPRTLMV